MNLYTYYDIPGDLLGYVDRDKLVPSLAYKSLINKDFSMYTREELEKGIVKSAEYAAEYAASTGRPLPEAEGVISRDPEFALLYAEKVIRGPWAMAESAILRYAETACKYVIHLDNGRWREAEPIILTDSRWAYLYAVRVIRGPWKEAEPTILAGGTEWIVSYASYVLEGRWTEAEPLISQLAGFSWRYVSEVIKGRWVEAEPAMKRSPAIWNNYIEFLEQIGVEL